MKSKTFIFSVMLLSLLGGLAFEKIRNEEVKIPARTYYYLTFKETREAAILWMVKNKIPTNGEISIVIRDKRFELDGRDARGINIVVDEK